MKKIFNFRLMPTIFISMILAVMIVYFSFYDMHYGSSQSFIYIGLVLFPLVVVLGINLFKHKLIEFFKSNYIYIFIVLTLFTVCLGVSYINLQNYDSMESMYDVKVTAHITNTSNVTNGKKLELTNATINGKSISENIVMYVYGNSDVTIGDNLSFSADIKVAKLYHDTINVYSFINNTPYSVYTYENLNITKGHKTITETIRSFVKDKLYSSMSHTNASVIYAMMFGEKQEIPSDIYDMFSVAGVAHILAVSGLHISIFVTLVSFVLSKLKVNKKNAFVITLVIILFYAGLCDFTPSILRAGVMSLVMLLSKIAFRKYDSISSLSFAGILYMLVMPLSVLTIGFQLSYLCVFAIITLSPYMRFIFTKIKLPNILVQSLSISVAINIVVFPICANVFESASVVGVVSNIVVLPIFNVVYVISLVSIILSVVPLLTFGLKLAEVGVVILIKISSFFSGINILNFQVFHISYIAMFVMVLALLILRFGLVKDFIKVISVIVLSLLTIIYVAIGFVPKSYTGINMMVDYQYSSNVVVFNLNSKVVVLGANIDNTYLLNILKNRKINKIDYLIAFDTYKTDKLKDLNTFDISTIYINDNLIGESGFSNIKYIKDNNIIENIFTFKPIEKAEKMLALDIYVHSTKVLVLNANLTKTEHIFIANNITSDYDYVVVNNLKYDYSDYMDYDFNTILSHGDVCYGYNNVINLENNYFYDINIKKGI